MECYPQVLVNIKITADKKGMWDKVPEITDAIKMYSEKLGDDGRILVRESGTDASRSCYDRGQENRHNHRICT